MKKIIAIILTVMMVLVTSTYAIAGYYTISYAAMILPYDITASYPNANEESVGRYYYYNLDDAIKDARAYKVNKYEISDQIEAFEALATDNIVLLKNCDMIGTSGINKGIVLDLNGYTVGSINPGVIPSDETLVITSYDKATITGAESVKDDENNTGVVYLDCAYLSIKGNINVGSHDICIHHKINTTGEFRHDIYGNIYGKCSQVRRQTYTCRQHSSKGTYIREAG